MERTESHVIQVAPDYENLKIKEMESFGWNLQNRQEIHEEGEVTGAPNVSGDKYIIKTKVYHYVKLHFSRSLNLSNLNDIKKIEQEYNSLPFPDRVSYKGPLKFFIPWFLLSGFLATILGGAGGAISVGGDIIGIVWIVLTVRRRNKTKQIWTQSQSKARELLSQSEALL